MDIDNELVTGLEPIFGTHDGSGLLVHVHGNSHEPLCELTVSGFENTGPVGVTNLGLTELLEWSSETLELFE